MIGWIIGLAILAVVIVWIRSNVTASASLVVTGPGVLKTHDVECRFRSGNIYHGKMSQSRWSDGQERVSLQLRKLPGAFTGAVTLHYEGQPIAEFDAKGGKVSFASKGVNGNETPRLEIGKQLLLEFGGQSLTGIVEPD